MFCRVCLCKNMQVYYRLNNNYANLMKTLTEVKMEVNDIVCCFCLATLRKIWKFTNAVKEADSVLKQSVKIEENEDDVNIFYNLNISTVRNISVECSRSFYEVQACNITDELLEQVERDLVKIKRIEDEPHQLSEDNVYETDSEDDPLMLDIKEEQKESTEPKDEPHQSLEDSINVNGTDSEDDPLITMPDIEEEQKESTELKGPRRLYNTRYKTKYEGRVKANLDLHKKQITINKPPAQVIPDIRPSVVVVGSDEKILEKSRNQNKIKLFENPEAQHKEKRDKDFCIFCENSVLNFARHVVRNHPVESEVQKALSFPKNSSSRRKILSLLRKKGNYIINTQNQESFKPMKKSRFIKTDDYLPCTKCLGFYSRKLLWKHKKKCDETYSTPKVQATAQDFLLRNIEVNQKLRDDVFPRMRPDKISLEAKKDPLICAFGLQYLRTHRESHSIHLTSRKMRELSKLLIEIRKIKSNVKCLLDALKPEYYSTLVLATKNACKFDSLKHRFNSPTYAINIATSIKQCCNIALLESYNSESGVNSAESQTDLKTVINLIQCNWNFDVSSQATHYLNIKKYNKTTAISLANDFKCLNDHLHKTAANSRVILTQSENSVSCLPYNELLETVICRLVLLNGRRSGELQRLQLSYYQNCENRDCENGKFEEFDRVLSTTEKMLVNNLKLIVLPCKRGQDVPFLFSSDVRKDIDTIISVRNRYVTENNDSLFAKTDGSILCGYKVLEKYAQSCGAKNPKALTSTRLRKHLATLTQLCQMSESDIELLTLFMGLTLSMHKQNYRLTDDAYQMAKILKLLLLMESGEADTYIGRSLEEINLNLEEEITGDNIQNEEILDYVMEETTYKGRLFEEVNLSLEEDRTGDNKQNEEILDAMEDTTTIQKPTETAIQQIPWAPYPCSTMGIVKQAGTKVKKNRRVLIPWSSDQKSVVLKFFSEHIKSKKAPKRFECENLKNQYPKLLQNKDWLKIKVFIQNIYSKQ